MSGVSWSIAGYIADVPIGYDVPANVWRGQVAGTGELIALKRIPFDAGDRLRGARAEAALLATLKHPHLIRLREVVPTADSIVLVLDFVAGGSLAELLQRRGRLSPGEVVTAIAPVGAALAYAHGSGVVHGDVSAATILFTELGLPMLAGLGISRFVGDVARRGSTGACVDPSVVRGAAPGPESDVFLLAATAYHALSGVALCPGDGGDLAHVDPLLLGLGVPVAMRDVLRRGLSIEASRRGTAAEFALDLRYAAEPTAVELTAGYVEVVRPAPAHVVPATLTEAIVARPPAAAPMQVGSPQVRHPVQQVPPPGSNEKRNAPLATPAHGELAATGHDGAAARPATAAGGHHRSRAASRSGPLTRIRSRIRWPHRPVRWVVAVLGAVMILAGAGVAWAFGSGRTPTHPDAPAAGQRSSAPAIPELGVLAPTGAADLTGSSSTSTSAGPSAGVVTAAGASQILLQLDALREQAYARRAPVLLTGVYEPGALLDEDTASLEKLVPVGCGLEGVHAEYERVTVTGQRGAFLDISALTTMPASVLFCNGTAKAQASGSGPIELHLVLVRSGTRYLIHAIAK